MCLLGPLSSVSHFAQFGILPNDENSNHLQDQIDLSSS